MSGEDLQFWDTVHTLVARALQSATTTWVSPVLFQLKDRDPDLRILSTGNRTLCLVLARDMLPNHHLEPHDVFNQILFLAEAFGLITPRRTAGPQFVSYSDNPSMVECGHVATLALDGQLPEDSIDRWYGLLGGRCPRCSLHTLGARPALSRAATGERICTPCGHDEAMRAPHNPEREHWPVPIIYPLPHTAWVPSRLDAHDTLREAR
jgi:hypothetical protein